MTPVARLVTRPPTVSMEEAERTMWERRVEKLPLVDEGGLIRGLVTMRDLHLFKRKPYSVKDERGRLRVGAAIGAAGDYLERAEALAEAKVDVILMDVAHAHSEILAKAVPGLPEPLPEYPARRRQRRDGRGCPLPRRPRRSGDQGRGRPRPRLPDPPRDGGGRTAAPGDP